MKGRREAWPRAIREGGRDERGRRKRTYQTIEDDTNSPYIDTRTEISSSSQNFWCRYKNLERSRNQKKFKTVLGFFLKVNYRRAGSRKKFRIFFLDV
jgi:hypothetical protein